MFKKALSADLKTIFGIDNIVFEKPENTAAQNCLCVDLSAKTQPTTVQPGQEAARVTGSVSAIGAEENQFPYGFLTKKIYLAPEEVESRFWFSRSEEPVIPQDTENSQIKTYRTQFVYFYKAEYDAPSGFMTYAKLFFEMLFK
ncbi:hypothetical protein Dip510_000052 [Elusimicrobium posterum]|uniref:hypothetical protein n=1 Tax=Elusimicrobium posterum TaxID=3116653 RepID=UPI003C72F537